MTHFGNQRVDAYFTHMGEVYDLTNHLPIGETVQGIGEPLSPQKQAWLHAAMDEMAEWAEKNLSTVRRGAHTSRS